MDLREKRDNKVLVQDSTILKNLYIIFVPLCACITLYFVEQSGGVNYAVKTLIKILLFLPLPMVYKRLFIKSSVHKALHIDMGRFKTGFIWGIIFFALLITGYYILKHQINLDTISQNLDKNVKVTAANFIPVAIYITLGNSFIEEYFFRGFVFLKLYENSQKKTAYIFSSLLFSLYHIMIFQDWFTLPLFLLAVFGLACVGLLFDYMDAKHKAIYNSWMSHILADSAIMLIGLKMFNII